jgi:hypothetical protein
MKLKTAMRRRLLPGERNLLHEDTGEQAKPSMQGVTKKNLNAEAAEEHRGEERAERVGL